MKRVGLFIVFFFLSFITGCANNNCVSPIASMEPDACCRTGCIDDLKGMYASCSSSASRGGECDVSAIRKQALQEEALCLGAQAGLAARARVINCQLEKNAKYLNRAFNFQLLLLPCSILPPVLIEGRQVLNLADKTTIRIADREYTILQQARFVTAPPHWREYLFLNFTQPDNPDNTMLPKNAQEKRIWEKFIVQGWNDGITQANNIYADDLARLKRDYMGMIRYRTLLAQHMVTAPYVSKTDLGITCDDSGMRIHDQVLRITALPQLCTDSNRWKPAVVCGGDGCCEHRCCN